jgi:hypothetical protein
MQTSDKDSVRTLDEGSPFGIQRVSPHSWSSVPQSFGTLVRMPTLDVFGAVRHALSDYDADFVHRNALDRAVDANATARRELDRKQADIPRDRQTAQHGIVGRRRHQRSPDDDVLAVRASHEAGLAAPHRRPEASIVSSGRHRDEALPRQKRQRASADLRRDDCAVSSSDVAFAGALLHRDFAGVIGLVIHGGRFQRSWHRGADQKVRMV